MQYDLNEDNIEQHRNGPSRSDERKSNSRRVESQQKMRSPSVRSPSREKFDHLPKRIMLEKKRSNTSMSNSNKQMLEI